MRSIASERAWRATRRQRLSGSAALRPTSGARPVIVISKAIHTESETNQEIVVINAPVAHRSSSEQRSSMPPVSRTLGHALLAVAIAVILWRLRAFLPLHTLPARGDPALPFQGSDLTP